MLEKKNEKSLKERMDEMLFCPTSVPSSKNGRRWTGRRFLPSKATVKWREETEWWWIENKDKFLELIKNKEKPYKIGLHFVRGTRHKYDWVNPVQTVQDEMAKHGWIDDDNVLEMLPFPLKLEDEYSTYNKEEPGFFLKII